MKASLFTTPHKGSIINYALDAQMEMDHQDVLKAFRSGATMESVLPCMSLTREQLGLNLSPTDITYILRITSLILRREGISTVLNNNIYNMYEARPDLLPESILDRSSNEAGQYLIRKFVSLNKLFGFDKTNAPNVNEISGPKTLVQKVKQAKGATVRRIQTKKQQTAKMKEKLKKTNG